MKDEEFCLDQMETTKKSSNEHEMTLGFRDILIEIFTKISLFDFRVPKQ